MPQVLRGIFWIAVYAIVTVSPLVVARIGAPLAGRGFVVDFSAALGFVALTIMVMQFGLVARLQHIAAPFGMDALVQFHRQVGYVALAFALAHPLLLFIADPQKLALLDVTSAPNRARFASGAVVALLLLVVTSIWRQRLRLSYEAWQVLHGILAVLIVTLALLHMAGVGYYAAAPWQRALWALMVAGVVGDMIWVRVLKPLRQRRRPWQVAEVIPERGDASSVVLTPVGHPGFRFEPGQFGWLSIDRSPFRVSQHPFSISSSAEAEGRVTMTIRARGDFTRTVASVEPGTRAYLDGPYGLFSIDQCEGFGFVFIAGGVGITPLMSMLRTMADREDRRPCLLVYASRDWEGVIFREELDELQRRLSLTVVHTLERPPDDWQGETGYIDAAMLRRHLPARYRRYRFFVCGPTPMMDAMEHALLELGVADVHINTERFDMV
jgi:predicted ferric reductase